VDASCRYRTLYESLQEVRSSCDAAVGGLAAAKEALLAGFNQWADQQAAQVTLSSQGLWIGGWVQSLVLALHARCTPISSVHLYWHAMTAIHSMR
jgi:hypothetical protein